MTIPLPMESPKINNLYYSLQPIFEGEKKCILFLKNVNHKFYFIYLFL
jgi:hypothetical protein